MFLQTRVTAEPNNQSHIIAVLAYSRTPTDSDRSVPNAGVPESQLRTVDQARGHVLFSGNVMSATLRAGFHDIKPRPRIRSLLLFRYCEINTPTQLNTAARQNRAVSSTLEDMPHNKSETKTSSQRQSRTLRVPRVLQQFISWRLCHPPRPEVGRPANKP